MAPEGQRETTLTTVQYTVCAGEQRLLPIFHRCHMAHQTNRTHYGLDVDTDTDTVAGSGMKEMRACPADHKQAGLGTVLDWRLHCWK